MSEATVTGHVSRVMAKLGGSNRVQVVIVVRDARPGLAGMAGGDFPLGGQVVDPGGGGERVWGRGGHQD
jgi:hypothetical protein